MSSNNGLLSYCSPSRTRLSKRRGRALGSKNMKIHHTILLLCAMTMVLTSCRTAQQSLSEAKDAFGELDGALVFVDCSSGRVRTYRLDAANTRFPPCSTFKIVNSLIGIEEGLVTSPQQSFYQWDGVERTIPTWNRDLSFQEAFQASSVPAFQNLARQIGAERMQGWIDKIGYGNRDISAGIDVFWLPAKGRKTIMISPIEQAELMRRVIAADVPFSAASLATLKELMFIKKTDRGTLYAKTGSGTDDEGAFVLGWFLGYTESKGKTYAFACVAQGKNVMSKQARTIVERVLQKEGLL